MKMVTKNLDIYYLRICKVRMIVFLIYQSSHNFKWCICWLSYTFEYILSLLLFLLHHLLFFFSSSLRSSDTHNSLILTTRTMWNIQWFCLFRMWNEVYNSSIHSISSFVSLHFFLILHFQFCVCVSLSYYYRK